MTLLRYCLLALVAAGPAVSAGEAPPAWDEGRIGGSTSHDSLPEVSGLIASN